MNIKIVNYSKKIKGKIVLDNINLEFHSKRIYGIRGVNGSGKTMLLRAICGFLISSSGKITIDGEVLGKDIDFPSSVGVMIETPAFLNNMTAFDNLKLLCKIKNEVSDTDIESALNRVGLSPCDSKKFGKFSLGMKQRLGIAAAIVEKPELLMLDEPFNALDQNGIQLISKIIKEEKDRGALVILVCHDNDLLKNLTDEIIEIKNGRCKTNEKKENNKVD